MLSFTLIDFSRTPTVKTDSFTSTLNLANFFLYFNHFKFLFIAIPTEAIMPKLPYLLSKLELCW